MERMSSKTEYMVDSSLTRQDAKIKRSSVGYSAGIRGWLLFYTAIPIGLFGVVLPVWWILTGTTQGLWGIVEIEIVRTVLNALGIYLILFVRNPVTRLFHIALNAEIGAELMLRGAVFSEIIDLSAGVAVIVVWSGYWYASKRIKATYCRKA